MQDCSNNRAFSPYRCSGNHKIPGALFVRRWTMPIYHDKKIRVWTSLSNESSRRKRMLFPHHFRRIGEGCWTPSKYKGQRLEDDNSFRKWWVRGHWNPPVKRQLSAEQWKNSGCGKSKAKRSEGVTCLALGQNSPNPRRILLWLLTRSGVQNSVLGFVGYQL